MLLGLREKNRKDKMITTFENGVTPDVPSRKTDTDAYFYVNSIFRKQRIYINQHMYLNIKCLK